MANARVPDAYDAKALRVFAARRVGLLLRTPVGAREPKEVGDFDRAAAAKGEDADAKASNPVRLTPAPSASLGDVGSVNDVVLPLPLVLALGTEPPKGESGGFLPNIEGPLALANGDAEA